MGSYKMRMKIITAFLVWCLLGNWMPTFQAQEEGNKKYKRTVYK